MKLNKLYIPQTLWKMQQIWGGDVRSTHFSPNSTPRWEQINWGSANARKQGWIYAIL